LAQEERIGLATAYKVVRKQLKLLKRQWTVNVTVQCSMISSAYSRKMKSSTPGALLCTQLTMLQNFWMRFLETVSSLQTYGPLACWILLHQSRKICSVSWSRTHA
jgi:hypothetical protein